MINLLHLRFWRLLGLGSYALLALAVFLVAAPLYAEGAGQAQVRADLMKYMGSRVEDSSATIEIPGLSGFAVDRVRHSGNLRTELSSRSVPPFFGRVPITISLYAGEHLIKRSVVSPYVRVLSKAVVPSRDLRRGEILSMDDLSIVERDEARMPGDALAAIEDAVGLRMKRSVRRGRVLRESALEGVPVIERGDRVTLILRSGLIEIQAIGQSRESGAEGDWIRVVNLDSKRELSGRVARNGQVHVAF